MINVETIYPSTPTTKNKLEEIISKEQETENGNGNNGTDHNPGDTENSAGIISGSLNNSSSESNEGTGTEHQNNKETEELDPYATLLENYKFELEVAILYSEIGDKIGRPDNGYRQILHDIAKEEYRHALHIHDILCAENYEHEIIHGAEMEKLKSEVERVIF